MSLSAHTPPAPLRWRAGRFEFAFPRAPLLMGIVNVTPDSFSDGGRFLDPAAALAHAQRLVAEGADLVDIGGESTRPNATPVAEAEELRRVLPVIAALRGRVNVPLSVDTQKTAVARAALDAGADIINDIAANRADDAMWRLAAETGAGYVAMHMRGTPQTMQDNPVYDGVAGEVGAFFGERLAAMRAAGLRDEQIVLDVGIGFGKTVPQNLRLLRSLAVFHQHGRPLLLGASRKSFIARLAGADECGRLPGSLVTACHAVRAGVQILRVHDVAATREALRVREVLEGADELQE